MQKDEDGALLLMEAYCCCASSWHLPQHLVCIKAIFTLLRKKRKHDLTHGTIKNVEHYSVGYFMSSSRWLDMINN